MARFPDAENRLFKKRICRKCNARNPVKATMCRKCGSTALRMKKKDVKA